MFVDPTAAEGSPQRGDMCRSLVRTSPRANGNIQPLTGLVFDGTMFLQTFHLYEVVPPTK
jgi:hypothetical protein